MPEKSPGTVPEPELTKAGCGIRYEPESLGDEVGFDFSKVEELKKSAQAETPDGAENLSSSINDE